MQVVGYEASPGATLLLSTDDGLRRDPLTPGDRLTFSLGDKHCAGIIQDDGHVPCFEPETPYCDEHTKRWACARCSGNCSMPLPACREEHAIYLAGFAPDTWKVGVTRSWRLDTRLQEQGADCAAHIRTVDTGRRARQIEAGIANELTDRVRIPTKIDGMHHVIDKAAWEDLLDAYDPIETFDFEYEFDLDAQPIHATTATGSVRGVKGRVLVLERGGTCYAVDLRELVGHEVTEQPSTRDLQSSLGTFE